jgi:hypothetical protein
MTVYLLDTLGCIHGRYRSDSLCHHVHISSNQVSTEGSFHRIKCIKLTCYKYLLRHRDNLHVKRHSECSSHNLLILLHTESVVAGHLYTALKSISFSNLECSNGN